MKAPAESISFVIATIHDGRQTGQLLAACEQAMTADDEVILLLRKDNQAPGTTYPPWVRVETRDDATIFQLRSQVPVLCRKEWIMMLEDHSLLEPETVAAVRQLIRARPDVELIPFLTKNLNARTGWDWALYLHSFAAVWAPLDRPPPYSIVTSSVVRRSVFTDGVPLKEGEWELRVIPRLYSSGKWAYSNEIFIDHLKPVRASTAFVMHFHNARAGAALQKKLGFPVRMAVYEGLDAFVRRPARLMRHVGHRLHEMPAGMQPRLYVIGFAHMLGNLAAVLFGGGRSAHQID